MAAEGVLVRIDGREAALAELQGYVERADDTRGMFDAIGAALVVSTQRRFEEGKAPDGSLWPPSLRALAEGGKTLVETARLMQSITHNAFQGSVEVGTNVLYAAIHQFGGTIRQAERTQTIYRRYDARSDTLSSRFVRRSRSNFAQDFTVAARDITIPARPFLGLDDDDETEIVRIAQDWLRGEAAP
jgi:phage virion morphogenesis protein